MSGCDGACTCVCRCIDIGFTVVCVEVCVREHSRVLVLDNCAVCICVFVRWVCRSVTCLLCGCWMCVCVSMHRCWICASLYVQVCDAGRVRVFVLDRRIAYAGVCALARAERYHGIHMTRKDFHFGA